MSDIDHMVQHKAITLDVRVECARFVEDKRQRTLDREETEIMFIVVAALQGRGYFNVDVVAIAEA